MRSGIYWNEWSRRTDEQLKNVAPNGILVTDEHRRETLVRALPGYLLFCFCEKYREKFATPWQHLDGLSPAHLRLIDKHHWLPDQVFSLKEEQLILLLHSELRSEKLPRQAYLLVTSDLSDLAMKDFQLPPYEEWTSE